jgi:hypothetical protein
MRPGPVLALQRPWWSVIAGGAGHVGSMGINDVPKEQAREIQRSVAQAVAAGEYAAVVLDGEAPPWLRPALQRGYRVGERRRGEPRAAADGVHVRGRDGEAVARGRRCVCAARGAGDAGT